ncbi:rhotekin-like [Pristis pectinata]|uniref:rhotekin-like n=1 Tax=Pristis pectinata TaxID=685728 RepID=UPI00223D32A9|nr:rhotekin-like [Pristis pectinata]
MDETVRIMEDLNLLYIRQMALSLQDSDFQKKIDYEIRMRDGACKLLAACTQKDQALEAAKSLMICNARITSYMSQVQRMKEAQVMQRRTRRSSDAGLLEDRLPCKGTVSISDFRIPLMWKDTEYFRNKGDVHRYAVFGLMQIGCDIYDTEMVIVDRTMTDICFESAVVFPSVGPDFELKVEFYSCCMDEDFSITSGPRKFASKLSSSLGRSSGRRVRAGLDVAGESSVSNGGSSPILLPTLPVGGPKYHLLAHISLPLAAVHSGFRTHSLRVVGNEECSFWLPLYGSMCCRLAAQPRCMTQHVITGFLNLQQLVGDLHNWTRVFCVLQGTNLLCYYSPEEVEAKVEAAFTIAINKSNRKRAKRKSNCISITNQFAGEEVTHTLVTDSLEEMHRWMEAFWQHFYDMSAWKQCCDELMKVESASPRKLPVTISKKGASLYHETVIDSPDDIDPAPDTPSSLVQTGASRRDGTLPPWYALFENSQKRVCRGTLLDGSVVSERDGLCTDWIQRHTFTVQPMDKDWNSQDFCTGESHFSRPRTRSLDAKLMSLKCQAQRTEALSNKRAALLSTSSTQTSSADSSPEARIKPFSQQASEQQGWRSSRCRLHTSTPQQTQV